MMERRQGTAHSMGIQQRQRDDDEKTRNKALVDPWARPVPRERDLARSVNPVVYLTLARGLEEAGTIKIELFADVVPKAAENFRALATGEERGKLTFVGTDVGKVHSTHFEVGMIEEGEVSLYGRAFDREPCDLIHTQEGVVSMVPTEPGKHSSGFAITLKPSPELDGKYTVVGRILSGMDSVQKISQSSLRDGYLVEPVHVSSGGQISEKLRKPRAVREEESELRRKAELERQQAKVKDPALDAILKKKYIGKKRSMAVVGEASDEEGKAAWEEEKKVKRIATKARRKFF